MDSMAEIRSEIFNSIELEAESSLSLSSIVQKSGKKREKTSSITPFTRPPSDEEPERTEGGALYYYCKICKIPSYKASATSTFRNHLQKEHKITAESNLTQRAKSVHVKIEELYEQLEAKNATKEIDSLILTKIVKKQAILEKLYTLIAVRSLPLSIVTSIEFREFCAVLNPESLSSIPYSGNTITRSMKELFQEEQDIIRKALQSARTRIHLAVDIWTSPNRQLYLAICGSFIDIQNRFWNLLLGLRTIHGHSGSTQWDVIKPVLDEYGITKKLGTIIGDNSGTNDTLCRTISDYMAQAFNMDWNAKQHRIRCHGHILNLVVQAFLFDDLTDEQLEAYDELELKDDNPDFTEVEELKE